MSIFKNHCRYCGNSSVTYAPFPHRTMPGRPKAAVCPKCYSLKRISLLEQKQHTIENELKESTIRQEFGSHKRKLVDNLQIGALFWFDSNDQIYGFQLSFSDGELDQNAFTWTHEKGSHYAHIYNQRRRLQTNTLQQTNEFPKRKILQIFIKNSGNMKREYRSLIIEKIRSHQ